MRTSNNGYYRVDYETDVSKFHAMFTNIYDYSTPSIEYFTKELEEEYVDNRTGEKFIRVLGFKLIRRHKELMTLLWHTAGSKTNGHWISISSLCKDPYSYKNEDYNKVYKLLKESLEAKGNEDMKLLMVYDYNDEYHLNKTYKPPKGKVLGMNGDKVTIDYFLPFKHKIALKPKRVWYGKGHSVRPYFITFLNGEFNKFVYSRLYTQRNKDSVNARVWYGGSFEEQPKSPIKECFIEETNGEVFKRQHIEPLIFTKNTHGGEHLIEPPEQEQPSQKWLETKHIITPALIKKEVKPILDKYGIKLYDNWSQHDDKEIDFIFIFSDGNIHAYTKEETAFLLESNNYQSVSYEEFCIGTFKEDYEVRINEEDVDFYTDAFKEVVCELLHEPINEKIWYDQPIDIPVINTDKLLTETLTFKQFNELVFDNNLEYTLENGVYTTRKGDITYIAKVNNAE